MQRELQWRCPTRPTRAQIIAPALRLPLAPNLSEDAQAVGSRDKDQIGMTAQHSGQQACILASRPISVQRARQRRHDLDSFDGRAGGRPASRLG